ncbi:MAG: glycosyltransferase family 4 protein [Armatimonadetes bacterium]|nr:glycosyltransferase family 4 protein [Armatimonadota bacterium]
MNLSPIVLYVQIAHGFSVEFRTFERITRFAGSAITPHILYNAYDSTLDETPRFDALATRQGAPCAIHPLDFGWRLLEPRQSVWNRYTNRARFAVAALASAVRMARGINPDVVVSSQQHWDCYVATVIAKRLRIPHILHLHYTVGDYLRPTVLKRLRTADQIITVSEFIRGEALRHGVAPDKVRAILNTVDPVVPPPPGTRERLRRELGVPEGGFLLGNISRLDPQKGQADILTAFTTVLKQFPETRLALVGSETPWHPGYQRMLETLARTLGVAEQTVFTGFRRDVPELLAAMDVFLHPSRHEPFGQATAEASQAGLPVVAYAEGGTQEVVTHSETGLLPPPESGAFGLADAIATLLSDRAMRESFGRAGRERMANAPFAPVSGAEAFVETVCKVIGRQAFGAPRPAARKVTP